MKYFLLFFFLLGVSVKHHAQKKSPFDHLPVEVLRGSGGQDEMVLYITGDGGWNRFSEDVGLAFTRKGYDVVVLNARKYFWESKTPEEFAGDAETLVSHYLEAWKKSACIIVGYSFGAEVAAFLPKKFTKALITKVRLLALISPSASTDFVIHLSDLIGGSDSKDKKYLVGEEISGCPVSVLCIFGASEDLILKDELKTVPGVAVEELPGSHRYNQKSALLVDRILSKR